MVAGSATWDEVFLSFRTEVEENGEYVPHVKLLLKYLDRQVFDQLERYEAGLTGKNQEVHMMTVSLGTESILVQRYCPHAGTDLMRQGVQNEDGTITCLAHRLCFDLRTGRI